MATFGTPLPRIEISIDKVPVTPMTAVEIADLKLRVNAVRELNLPQLHDADNPHSRLYVMALDGTQNDAINDPEHITNVGLIDRSLHRKDDPHVISKYTEGVGNQPFIASVVDSALGLTVEDQGSDAYNNFVEQANAWHRADPEVIISMVGVGFSRGASTLLIASKMVHEKGIPDLDSPFTLQPAVAPDGSSHVEKVYSRHLIPPGEVRQALILNDQVATGAAEYLDRRVPPSVASVVQFKAEHEFRSKFPFYNAENPNHPDPRFHTFPFPGAHSDIGGSYLLNGISSNTLLANEIILNKYGAGIPESQPETAPKKYVIHDSEYLWNDRHAETPTPPLASRPARIVIPAQTEVDAASTQVPDLPVQTATKTTLREHLHEILSEWAPEQQAIFISRMRDNLSPQEITPLAAGAER